MFFAVISYDLNGGQGILCIPSMESKQTAFTSVASFSFLPLFFANAPKEIPGSSICLAILETFCPLPLHLSEI